MKGSLRQRSPGSWSLILYLGRDPLTGKKRQKWVTFQGNKRDAQRELNRLLSELQSGDYVAPVKLTVGEYLERWLQESARPNVSLKSYQSYELIVRRHLIPSLGHIQLAKLAPLQLQAYLNRMLESGRADGRGGLSAQTVNHHHQVLRTALRQAVRWQLLARNPLDAVDPPRVERQERPILTIEETVTVLERSKGTHVYLPVLLAVTTGLRAGEVLGIRWQDVDFKSGLLTVRQSLENSRRAGIRFKSPKTAKSRRPIDLPDFVVAELQQARLEQARNRELLGETYQDYDLVCSRGDGSPWPVYALSRAFAQFIRQLPVTQVRYHDLRHTQVAILIKGGFHPKLVSERMGHSGIAITMDRYGHLMPGMGQDAARYVHDLLAPPPPPPPD